MPPSIYGEGQNIGGCDVYVVEEDGTERELDERFDLHRHSPTGFQWGYSGSGPAQLALAVLAEFYNDEFAMEHYQQFKKDFVAHITGGEDFTLKKSEVEDYFEVKLGVDTPA